MNAAKRTSQEIDKELESLRAKIRSLEAQKTEHVKALEEARADRKRSAYSAHSDKDAKAQERLAKARAAQRESELAMEDFENALSEGRARFDALQKEYEVAYRAEEWEKVLALAAEAQKEAETIDVHITGLTELLGSHQAKLEELKARAHNLGHERAFQTCGIRHAFRVMDWHTIRFAPLEVEKPTEVYRKNTYARILSQQIEAAKAQPATQPNGHDTAGTEAEADTGAADAGAGRAEA